MVKFQCPACDKAFRASSENTGKAATCPECGQRFRLQIDGSTEMLADRQSTDDASNRSAEMLMLVALLGVAAPVSLLIMGFVLGDSVERGGSARGWGYPEIVPAWTYAVVPVVGFAVSLFAGWKANWRLGNSTVSPSARRSLHIARISGFLGASVGLALIPLGLLAWFVSNFPGIQS